MKLTFLGADREVTGSCTQLEAAGHRFLIDCGMEQGRDVYENADLPCAPGTYEALLLTHAHIDHSGRIPYLYKNGYRGPIYTTDATRDLCAIMLEDSAHIQEQEAEWKNRKAMRSGAEMIEPDYTVEDAQNVMKQFVPCPYEAWQTLFDGPTGKIEMRFTDVGHLLGSASVSLRIAEPGRTPEIIVFSGDIGNTHQPLIKDPSNPGHADYLVMESTYGDRSHGPKPDYIGDLSAVLQSTFDKGGNVVIPSFAVGRTQELLYFIRQIKAEGRIKGHENFPVFVDSPLASKSTTIFRENFAECYDDEALALVQSEYKNNANSNTVEVVYMTTKPKTDLPTHVYIESALRPSTLLCEQISTVSEERIGEWIGELTESEVQDLDIALAVSLGMKCGPGQLDTDTLEHLNNLQAELDRTKAELREAKSGPDYKLLYDQLIEKMLSR